jgi:FixJ family two-component response regulator
MVDTEGGSVHVWFPPDRQPHLAIAEDDDDMRETLAEILEDDGFRVTPLSSGEGLVRYLEECRDQSRLPDLVILDHRMPGWQGLDILQALRENGWTIPVVFMTGFKDITPEARQLGACAVLQKPFDAERLVTAICDELGFEVPHGHHHTLATRVNLVAARCISCRKNLGVRIDAKNQDAFFCDACWDPPAEDRN